MGAMLISMVTGGIAMICIIAITAVYAAVIFIDAYRHNMKAFRWAFMAFFFNLYMLPVYIYVRVKIATLKCQSCGERVGGDKDFCPECGTAVQKVDDGKIAKKVILCVLAAYTAIMVIGMAYIIIVDGITT